MLNQVKCLADRNPWIGAERHLFWWNSDTSQKFALSVLIKGTIYFYTDFFRRPQEFKVSTLKYEVQWSFWVRGVPARNEYEKKSVTITVTETRIEGVLIGQKSTNINFWQRLLSLSQGIRTECQIASECHACLFKMPATTFNAMPQFLP